VFDEGQLQFVLLSFLVIISLINQLLVLEINTILKQNGVFTSMKSAISLFIFIIFFAFCQAQQCIILTSNVTNIGISDNQIFKLPIKVLCKFKDKTTKVLVLERVVGNILFFDSLFSHPIQSNQLYSE
jgi:hypothetical protein